MDKTDLLDKLAFEQFKTQSDFLAEKIKHMIVKGEFSDGYVFPNENEFCKILNVSRGTLRDAYKKLDTQGFIERTKVGTYVKSRDTIARQGNYAASLELAEQKEVEEFICVFEPQAVAMAAKKIDDSAIAELERLQEECEKAANDYTALSEANYRFHEFIREQVRNNLMISVLTAYYDIFSRHNIDTIYELLKEGAEEFRDNALRQHRELVEAFKKRDGDAARNIAYDHLIADLKMQEKLK